MGNSVRNAALAMVVFGLAVAACNPPRTTPMRDAGVDAPLDARRVGIDAPPYDAPTFDAPDAPPVPCGPATLAFSARIVEGPSGAPLAGARVRAEGRSCSDVIEATSGADGSVTLMVDRAGRPWAITAAMPGHRVVSVLHADTVGSGDAIDLGDIQLDVAPDPAISAFPASGTLTGSVGVGNTVRLDGFGFATLASTSATWTSEHYAFAGLDTPTRFAAVEVDPMGRAVNIGITPEGTRPAGPLTGVALALPSPAEVPREHTIRIQLSPAESLAGMAPATVDLLHVQDGPFEPYVYVGSAIWGPPTGVPGAFDVVVRDFAVLPGNWLVARFESPLTGRVLNVLVDDVSADATISVAGPGSLEWLTPDRTYGGLSAGVVDGGDFGYVALHLGESGTGDPPIWRVFAPMSPGVRAGSDVWVPQLPTGMTLAGLGLGAPREGLLMAIYMQSGSEPPWSLQARNQSVRGYRATLAGAYEVLDPSGR